jgi:hypothetical protein
MQTMCKIAVLAVLLIMASPSCFALWGLAPVSKEMAKKIGIEVRAQPGGPNHVWVELQFKTQGEFKSFAEGQLKEHSRVELHMGDQLSAALREDRSKPGRIVVGFTAARAQLDTLSLWVMVAEGAGGSAYTLSVKDFVEPEKKR